jgi:hypothetical protein
MEEQKLECLVCSEEFKSTVEGHQPRLLKCAHSFCYGCMKKLHKNGKIECPVCREVTTEADPSNLKLNYQFQSALELISPPKKTTATLPCSEECGKNTSAYCPTCPDSPPICEGCFKITHGTKAKSSHQLKPIVQRVNATFAKCPDHHEYLKLFCYDDEVTCCFLCANYGAHKGHKTALCNEAARDLRTQVAPLLKDATQQLASASLKLQKTRHQEQQERIDVISLDGLTRSFKACGDEKNDDAFLQRWIEAKKLAKQVSPKSPAPRVPSLPTIKIIDPRKFAELMSQISQTNARLIYSGQQHGWAAQDFHTHCDNKGPTLVLVQDIQGNIFGGYTPVSWQSHGGYQADPSNTLLLFSVKSPSSNNLKIFRVQQGATHAIWDHVDYSPTFGGGHDLYICNNSNSSQGSGSNLGTSYTNDTKNPYYLTDQKYFQVLQLEVYAVDNG